MRKKHDINTSTALRKMMFDKSGILEDFKELKDNIIKESYNLYTGIEEDVDFLTNCIIDTIATMKGSDGAKEYEYKLNNLTGIKKIIVNIENVELHKKSASISVDGDTITIDIVIGMLTRWLKLNDMRKIMHYGIERELVHELTHGKIQTKRKTDIVYNDNDYLGWYDIACLYITYQGKEENIFLYKFFYSLYASDYEEVQAYSSEATYEVGIMIQDIQDWNKLSRNEKIEKINTFLHKTEWYKNYTTILYSYLPIIKQFDKETIEEIFKYFKKYSYNITKKEYNDFVKQIEFSCKRALSKMNRGLVKYYEEYNLN